MGSIVFLTRHVQQESYNADNKVHLGVVMPSCGAPRRFVGNAGKVANKFSTLL